MMNQTISRRGLLLSGGALAGVAALGRLPVYNPTRHGFGANPFSLGVASGDPAPDGVVLWTRLAPDPLHGGGMPPAAVPVEWRVAADESMTRVAQSGTAMATPKLAHAVHVEVDGLEPARWYWYQFKVGSEWSPIGRTRTAPAPGARVDRLAFAFASCQNWEHGYYTAFQHMAADDLDLIVHLGDYVYPGRVTLGGLRRHNSLDVTTLAEYRNRHALYKTDPALRAAHAAAPWIATLNQADAVKDGDSRTDLLARRAAAYQAFYEHMPLRVSSMPAGPAMQIYRRLAFGDLAEFTVLDTRQFRDDEDVCGEAGNCDAVLDPGRSMLGMEQERWLAAGLDRSRARWNVLTQTVVMARFDEGAGPTERFDLTGWDSYPAARARLLDHIARARPSNPVVITGDSHSSWVNDLKADFRDPASATLATEFVGTSISSPFESTERVTAALPANPHVRFFNSDLRGYTRVTLTPRRWQTDLRAVESVLVADAPVRTLASFVVEDGKAGAVQT